MDQPRHRNALDERLCDAIVVADMPGVTHAIQQGADVIVARGSKEDGDFQPEIPLFLAMYGMDVGIVNLIITSIISQVKKTTTDPAQLQAALATHLFERKEHDDKKGRTALEIAAGNDSEGMLAMVWEHFKDHTDINRLYDDDNRLVHWAARHYKNLVFLMSKGADIRLRDGMGRTALMRTFAEAFLISPADVGDFHHMYEQEKANVHDVDKGGQGLAHCVLDMHDGRITTSRQSCIVWAAKQGVNFSALDNQGKAPFDRVMDRADLFWPLFQDLLWRLAIEGSLNTPAIVEKYRDKPAVIEVMRAAKQRLEAMRTESKTITVFDACLQGRMQVISGELAASQAESGLWTAEEKPSELLLNACMYELLNDLFHNAYYEAHPEAARELYQKMEGKLPERYREVLRTKVDLSTLQREVKNIPPSDAIARALKRENPARRSYPGQEK